MSDLTENCVIISYFSIDKSAMFVTYVGMYVYITTYRFAIKDGKNRPIYNAYRSFLTDTDAVFDDTTSTAYFKYNGNISDLISDIKTHFRDNKITHLRGKDKKDIISLLCLYVDFNHNISLIDIRRIENNKEMSLSNDIQSLFTFTYEDTVNDIITTLRN